MRTKNPLFFFSQEDTSSRNCKHFSHCESIRTRCVALAEGTWSFFPWQEWKKERGGAGREGRGELRGGHWRKPGVLPGTEAALNRAQFEPVSPGRTHWGFIAGSSEYVVSSAEGKYCCLVEFLREGSLVWESGAELPEKEEGGSGSLLLCLLRQAVLDLLRGPSPGCGVPGATGPGPSVGGCPFQGSCAQAGWVWLRFLFSRRAVAF